MKKLNLTKVNVLVVERHLFIRQLMRDVLRALGACITQRYPTPMSFLTTPAWKIRQT